MVQHLSKLYIGIALILTRLPGIPHPLVGGAGEASQSIGLTINPFCAQLGV
jgi:hypothetical protein